MEEILPSSYARTSHCEDAHFVHARVHVRATAMRSTGMTTAVAVHRACHRRCRYRMPQVADGDGLTWLRDDNRELEFDVLALSDRVRDENRYLIIGIQE